MSILAAALDLAELNIPVFPCSAPKKTPTTPRGFKDAIADPAEVRRLWRAHPGPLIGVPTGAVSGFDVLDVDPRHNGHVWWIAHRDRIPATRMHRTRSGGLHVLFRHAEPVRNTQGKLGTGIDTRGEGGYVIWWPAHGCQVTDAPLAPWPQWLLKRLLARPARPQSPSVQSHASGPDKGADALAERVLQRLEAAPAGERHFILRKSAYTLGGLLDRLPYGEAEATRRLLAAVERAGAEDLTNAAKTAAWGLACGRSAPLLPREVAR